MKKYLLKNSHKQFGFIISDENELKTGSVKSGAEKFAHVFNSKEEAQKFNKLYHQAFGQWLKYVEV